MDEDRGERARYMGAETDDLVLLPITRDGFEAMLHVCTALYNLPIDDAMRAVLAGYIHHIPNEKNQTTISEIARVLYKSISNSTTWRIDQEIKAKKREHALAAQKKAQEDALQAGLEPERALSIVENESIIIP